MSNKTAKNWKSAQTGAVTTIYADVVGGWEQWILHLSDVHFDSIYCNRELLQEHLDLAVKRKARVNIYGDWFDAMQGKFDPRRNYGELREEYKREDYFDFVVRDSATWLAQYASIIDVMTDGNHELTVLKNANTNLMDRLVSDMRWNNKCLTQHGGYGGWIRYMFNMSGGENTGPRTSIRVKYFHGSGGESPVTRGVIQTNRQAVYLPDANIVVNGHNHNAFYVPIVRERLNTKGQHYMDIQHHIRIPGYKQSYADGSTGWDVTRGGVPKPLGGFWTLFKCEKNGISIKVDAEIESPLPISTDSNVMYSGRIDDDDSEGV